MHRGDYSDPFWAMRTLTLFRDYIRLAVENEFMLVIIVTDKGPDRLKKFPTILMEALSLNQILAVSLEVFLEPLDSASSHVYLSFEGPDLGGLRCFVLY